MIRCEQCGAMNDRAQNVCEFCGTPLEGGDQSEIAEREDTVMDNALPFVIVMIVIAFFVLAILMGFFL